MKAIFKRLLSGLLCFVLCFLMTSCGKSDAAKNAEVLIAQIGEVTLENQSIIENAKQQYDCLTEREKQQVENYDLLEKAIIELEVLQENEAKRIADEERRKQEILDAYSVLLQWIADNGMAIVEEKDINQYGQIRGYSYQYKCRDDRIIEFSYKTDGNGNIDTSEKLYIEWENSPKEYNLDAHIDYDLNNKLIIDVANEKIEYIWTYGAWAISINKSNTIATGTIRAQMPEVTQQSTDYLIEDYKEIDTFRQVSGYKDVRLEIVEDFNMTLRIFAEFLKIKVNLDMRELGFIKYSDFDSTVAYVGMKAENQTISAGDCHILALKTDGTVLATGDNAYGQCDVADWTDIISVSAGYNHSVALKADGTVLATGDNTRGQCEVSDWSGIVAICAGWHRTFGVRADGTVVVTGGYTNIVSNWSNIIGVYDTSTHTVGLRADGTVVVAGRNAFGECDVSQWTDIVDISACTYTTVGLKKDGTIVVAGNYAQDERTTWLYLELTNVVDIAAIPQSCLAVRANETLVEGNHAPMDTDIVAISATGGMAVFLKKDGTVHWWSAFTKVDASDWTDIKLPE